MHYTILCCIKGVIAAVEVGGGGWGGLAETQEYRRPDSHQLCLSRCVSTLPNCATSSTITALPSVLFCHGGRAFPAISSFSEPGVQIYFSRRRISGFHSCWRLQTAPAAALALSSWEKRPLPFLSCMHNWTTTPTTHHPPPSTAATHGLTASSLLFQRCIHARTRLPSHLFGSISVLRSISSQIPLTK